MVELVERPSAVEVWAPAGALLGDSAATADRAVGLDAADATAAVFAGSDAPAAASRPAASVRDSVITSALGGVGTAAVGGVVFVGAGRGGITSAGALSWRGISIGMSTGTGLGL